MNDRIFSSETDAAGAIGAAVAAVRAGEVIVLPTDTVYGVGADANNPDAVQKLLDAKQRGRDFPPPVLVAEAASVLALADGVDDRVNALAEAFWPGALTLVLRSAAWVTFDLGDRGATIAVRVPDHDFTRNVLRRTGPLAVSSANVHGQDAAVTAQEAYAQLGDLVAVYLDAGPGTGPVASTIVDLTTAEARVLREGRISTEQLNAVVPGLLPEPDPKPQPQPELEAEPAASGPEADAGPEPGETPPRA